MAELKKQKSISLDTETTNIMPRWAELVGLSFSWDENEAWYLPVRSPPGEPHLDLQATLDALRPVLEDPAIEKIGQNLKYDIIVLRGQASNWPARPSTPWWPAICSTPASETTTSTTWPCDYLGHSTIKISELIGTGKNQKRMDEVPTRQVADYAAKTPCCPSRLRPILAKKLGEPN